MSYRGRCPLDNWLNFSFGLQGLQESVHGEVFFGEVLRQSHPSHARKGGSMISAVILASSLLAVVLVVALVREVRLRRALQRLLSRLLAVWRNRHAGITGPTNRQVPNHKRVRCIKPTRAGCHLFQLRRRCTCEHGGAEIDTKMGACRAVGCTKRDQAITATPSNGPNRRKNKKRYQTSCHIPTNSQ